MFKNHFWPVTWRCPDLQHIWKPHKQGPWLPIWNFLRLGFEPKSPSEPKVLDSCTLQQVSANWGLALSFINEASLWALISKVSRARAGIYKIRTQFTRGWVEAQVKITWTYSVFNIMDQIPNFSLVFGPHLSVQKLGHPIISLLVTVWKLELSGFLNPIVITLSLSLSFSWAKVSRSVLASSRSASRCWSLAVSWTFLSLASDSSSEN